MSRHQWLRGAEGRCVCDRLVCLRRVRISGERATSVSHRVKLVASSGHNRERRTARQQGSCAHMGLHRSCVGSCQWAADGLPERSTPWMQANLGDFTTAKTVARVPHRRLNQQSSPPARRPTARGRRAPSAALLRPPSQHTFPLWGAPSRRANAARRAQVLRDRRRGRRHTHTTALTRWPPKRRPRPRRGRSPASRA